MTRICISNNFDVIEVVNVIARCKNLSYFKIHDNNLDLGKMNKILSTISKLPKLQTLLLIDSKIAYESIETLSEYLPKCKNLTTLNLSKNYIGIEGTKAIIKMLPTLHKLTSLNLSKNLICSDSLEQISTLSKSNIKYLDLSNNLIAQYGAQHLGKFIKSGNSKITDLDLSKNMLREKGASFIINSLPFSRIETLKMSENNIGANGAISIATILKNCKSLKHLDLSRNNIGNYAIKLIALSLDDHHLSSLMLSHNGIDYDTGVFLIEKLSQCNNLQKLDLNHNELGAPITLSIAESLSKWPNLSQIFLGGNDIGDSGIGALVNNWNHCLQITDLDLSYNNVRSAGVNYLIKILGSFGSLHHLNMEGNNISNFGAIRLAQALSTFEDVKLNLMHNKINYIGYRNIAEIVRHHNIKISTDIDWMNAHRLFYIYPNGIGAHDANQILLQIASCSMHNPKITKYLLSINDTRYPFSINAEDKNGITIASYFMHHDRMIYWLIKHGYVPHGIEFARNELQDFLDDSDNVHKEEVAHASNNSVLTLLEILSNHQDIPCSDARQLLMSYIQTLINLDSESLSHFTIPISDSDKIISGKDLLKIVYLALENEYMWLDSDRQYNPKYYSGTLWNYTLDKQISLGHLIEKIVCYINSKYFVESLPINTIILTWADVVEGIESQDRENLLQAVFNNSNYDRQMFIKELNNNHSLLELLYTNLMSISCIDFNNECKYNAIKILIEQIGMAATAYLEDHEQEFILHRHSSCPFGVITRIANTLPMINAELFDLSDDRSNKNNESGFSLELIVTRIFDTINIDNIYQIIYSGIGYDNEYSNLFKKINPVILDVLNEHHYQNGIFITNQEYVALYKMMSERPEIENYIHSSSAKMQYEESLDVMGLEAEL
ncbi:MAG: hypothetical protein AB8B67_03095 [Rickettsiaceae bacterium]